MAEYSAEAAEKVLTAASENAAFMDRHAGLGKPALPVLPRDRYQAGADIHDPAQKTYIDFAKALDAYVAEKYPALISRTIVATEDSMENAVRLFESNQNGTEMVQ